MKSKLLITIVAIAIVTCCMQLSACRKKSIEQTDLPKQPEQMIDNNSNQTELGSYKLLINLKKENIEDYDDPKENLISVLHDLNDDIAYDEAQRLSFNLKNSQNAIFVEEWIWCNTAQLVIDHTYYIMFLYCTPYSPVSAIMLKVLGSDEYEITYYNNEKLYNYIKHIRDYDYVIDQDAYDKYGEYVLGSVKEAYDFRRQESDGIQDFVLKRFEDIWYVSNTDGSEIKVFRFDYAMKVDLEVYRGVGGEYLDSNCLIEGTNGMFGQLIVKVDDGKVSESRILDYDEMIFPEMQSEDEINRVLG